MFRLGQNVQWTFCQGTFHPGTKKITMMFLSYERIAIFQVKNKLLNDRKCPWIFYEYITGKNSTIAQAEATVQL
jgi:hypothetical protein